MTDDTPRFDAPPETYIKEPREVPSFEYGKHYSIGILIDSKLSGKPGTPEFGETAVAEIDMFDLVAYRDTALGAGSGVIDNIRKLAAGPIMAEVVEHRREHGGDPQIRRYRIAVPAVDAPVRKIDDSIVEYDYDPRDPDSVLDVTDRAIRDLEDTSIRPKGSKFA